jgi:hypothetical protein
MTDAPWHELRPEELTEFKEGLRDAFPELRVDVEGADVLVRGTLSLKNSEAVVDEFFIEARVPPSFPADLPVVREVGGRIPQTMDRHVIPITGTACLFVTDDREAQFPAGSKLLRFFDGPVRSYFFSQSYFEKTGEWPFGERPHGIDGCLDFYRDRLGLPDSRLVPAALRYLRHPRIPGHLPCFCGATRVRTCHQSALLQLQREVPQDRIKALLTILSTSEAIG